MNEKEHMQEVCSCQSHIFQIKNVKLYFLFWQKISCVCGCMLLLIYVLCYCATSHNIIIVKFYWIIYLTRDAPDRKITGYWISGQNTISDILYLIGYLRRQFLWIEYLTFSGYLIGFRVSSKKKVYKEKDCNFVTIYKIL